VDNPSTSLGRDRLLIIDGNALMHRAYHAIPMLNNKSGAPTNAVYGFILMLQNLLNNFKPKYLLVAFDEAEKTFRKKDYEGYQAKRPKMDDWLVSQMALVRVWLEVANIQFISKGGYEADDVIGTLVKRVTEISKSEFLISKQTPNSKSKAQNKTEINETVIVTGDRDIFQLINEKVKVFTPTKGLNNGKLWGSEEVKLEFDFAPIQMVDYKALVGDSSDNYPGVTGIGPKSARDLIVKYQTIENIYQHLSEIPTPIRAKLEKGAKEALFFHKLATIFTEVPINFNLNECDDWDLASESVIKFYQEYGFRSFLAKMREPALEAKELKLETVKQMSLI
jgi:DNA polymerase-1